jgi:hypothetical protein
MLVFGDFERGEGPGLPEGASPPNRSAGELKFNFSEIFEKRVRQNFCERHRSGVLCS